MKKLQRDRQLLLIGLVILGLLATACTAERSARPQSAERTSTPATQEAVRGLTNIELLKHAFNQDFGKTRLVLLLSPT
jgi:hypothetical protein